MLSSRATKEKVKAKQTKQNKPAAAPKAPIQKVAQPVKSSKPVGFKH